MNNVKIWSYTVVRIVLGVIFLVHGMAKFQMGLSNVAHFSKA